MVLIHRLLALPPALISLVLNQIPPATAQELPWPYNLPPQVKYYPEDEVFVKRNLDMQQKLREQMPIGIKKMSGDPGQKFFLDYWQFRADEDEHLRCVNNLSIIASFDAPLKPHIKPKSPRPILPRTLGGLTFEKRDFQCPAGSQACTSINRPNSCCATGSTCQLVQDNGLGDVGCCPANQVCGGSVSTCPAGGYTNCPQNPGGGCCLPGYACYDVGCVAVSTAVVTVLPTSTSTSISTSISTSSSPPPPSTVTQTTTTVVAPPPPPPASSTSSTSSPPPSSTSSSPSPTPTSSAVTTITTVTSTSSSSSSTVSNISVCSSGFRSCPASLGGGCCPTDRACARDVCPEISSTGSFSAPGRPTSNTASVTSTSTASSFSSISGVGCPTGFYACSAYYGGGCCQTGRDCAVTSCPTGGSITVVGGSTVSVIAPTGSGISSVGTLLTGACAGGWTTCAANVGGGCCPSGYACGTACTATATGGQGNQVGKIAPQSEAGQTLPLERKSTLALLVIFVALVILP